MNTKGYEKHYEKVIEKLIEEASVPDSERAATMLAQLEADMDGNSGKPQEKKPDADKAAQAAAEEAAPAQETSAPAQQEEPAAPAESPETAEDKGGKPA